MRISDWSSTCALPIYPPIALSAPTPTAGGASIWRATATRRSGSSGTRSLPSPPRARCCAMGDSVASSGSAAPLHLGHDRLNFASPIVEEVRYRDAGDLRHVANCEKMQHLHESGSASCRERVCQYV